MKLCSLKSQQKDVSGSRSRAPGVRVYVSYDRPGTVMLTSSCHWCSESDSESLAEHTESDESLHNVNDVRVVSVKSSFQKLPLAHARSEY